MIDADHFKAINDQFGHDQGDEALISIANVVRRSVGEGDLVGRIGGEEFAVYLSGRSAEQVERLAERMRRLVSNQHFEPCPGEPWPLSVSIGAATAPSTCLVEDLLKLADRSMYRAKKGGRDRVVVSTAA
jgi:diguanylate cyclase (GGDEF)-like protein